MVILDGNIPSLDVLNRALVDRDLIALVSDTNDPMIIDGYRTTHELGSFIILQGKSELEIARKHLSKTAYYRLWTEECRQRIGLPYRDKPESKHVR